MPTLKEIDENLEMISTIKNIAGTYQEIANLRMRQIREKVLKNRKFFEELANTYQRIKSAYLLSFKKREAEKRGFRFRKKKGTVVVYFSANKFFYGTLTSDIWAKILDFLKRERADLAVVGRMGKYLAEGSGFGHKMFYFELDDVRPEEEKIKGILEFIEDYKRIIVFHGRYETALFQRPVKNEISTGLPFKKVENVKSYLFEPSPEAVLEFFETEIIATLFNQCILEHQLAKHAARVMAMYRATENAKNSEQRLRSIKNKLERQNLNKKQIEFFSSLKL